MFAKILLFVLAVLVLLLGSGFWFLLRKVRFFQEREKSRQRYMEDVFHKLKTSLAAIKVLADSLLSQEDAGIDIYREFMEDIRIETDRENDIICDFLSLVRLENEEIAVSEFSVNKLAKEVVSLFLKRAEEKHIHIYLEAQQEIKICSDKKRVTDILMNLVENAVKYTNIEGMTQGKDMTQGKGMTQGKDMTQGEDMAQGFVKVILFLESETCCIKVSDSGIGISKEEQNRVFERFYRVRSQALEAVDGTGLGLSIVRSSISALSGSISLESAEGKGSTFLVKIPVKTPAKKKDRRKHISFI